MQPSWWICHDRKLKNQLPAMCWWFDSAFTESGLQRTLNRYAAAYDAAGIKIGKVKTSRFKKPLSVLVATEWNDTETRVQVQVSWGCIHEWRMARRRTVYPICQGNRNNENFELFSSCETRIVEKKQSSQFLKQSLSLLTCCISGWSRKFGNDWKGAIAIASFRNEVSPKYQRSYIIDQVHVSWDSKFSETATSPN